jgi:hypothetical protein
MRGQPQAFGSRWLSALRDTFASMFDSFELSVPAAVAGLDDIGLIDTMELATVLETLAVDVQIAVIREICRRQVRGATGRTPAHVPAEVRPRH